MDRIASFVRAASAALILALAPAAAAQAPSVPPTMPNVPKAPTSALQPGQRQPHPRTVYRGYGYQILLADGVLAAVALASQRAEPAIGLLLTGPIIHGVHGNAAGAVDSLALRTLLPVVGLVLGLVTCSEDHNQDDLGCLDNVFYGFGIGGLSAAGLDYLALSRQPVPAKPGRVKPGVTVTATGTSASLRLVF